MNEGKRTTGPENVILFNIDCCNRKHAALNDTIDEVKVG